MRITASNVPRASGMRGFREWRASRRAERHDNGCVLHHYSPGLVVETGPGSYRVAVGEDEWMHGSLGSAERRLWFEYARNNLPVERGEGA